MNALKNRWRKPWKDTKPDYVNIIKRAFGFARLIRRFIQWRLMCVFRNTFTIVTKGGIFTALTKDIGVGFILYVHREYEEYDSSIRAVEMLKSSGYVPSGNITMLDVGANIGVINIGLLRSGLIDHAIAIEPGPQSFDLLLKNVLQNMLRERVVCLQLAASEKKSMLTMELSSTNPGDNRVRVSNPMTSLELNNESKRQTIEMPSLPLGDILQLPEVSKIDLSTLAFMWIDVQGYEGYVFRGAHSLLQGGMPTMTEVWPYGILRAGMSLKDFHDIVASIWTHYWVERNGKFIRYPIAVFDCYLDELGIDGEYGNVILTAAASCLQTEKADSLNN